MSLLRERAIAVSFESTLSDLSPAAARAWLVIVTSCDSDAELNAFVSQPRAERGTDRIPIAVTVNAISRSAANRRGSALSVGSLAGRGRVAIVGTVIGTAVSRALRTGDPVSPDRMAANVVRAPERWSRSHRVRVPEAAPHPDVDQRTRPLGPEPQRTAPLRSDASGSCQRRAASSATRASVPRSRRL